MAFLKNQKNKLTTKPARSVKKITKPKAKPNVSILIGSRSPDKKIKAPKAPTSPRKPPTAKKPKTPTNVKPNVAGRAAAKASLASQRRTGGRENTGKKVTRTTAKPVKNRTSVKVSQRSKKMK